MFQLMIIFSKLVEVLLAVLEINFMKFPILYVLFSWWPQKLDLKISGQFRTFQGILWANPVTIVTADKIYRHSRTTKNNILLGGDAEWNVSFESPWIKLVYNMSQGFPRVSRGRVSTVTNIPTTEER